MVGFHCLVKDFNVSKVVSLDTFAHYNTKVLQHWAVTDVIDIHNKASQIGTYGKQESTLWYG